MKLKNGIIATVIIAVVTASAWVIPDFIITQPAAVNGVQTLEKANIEVDGIEGTPASLSEELQLGELSITMTSPVMNPAVGYYSDSSAESISVGFADAILTTITIINNGTEDYDWDMNMMQAVMNEKIIPIHENFIATVNLLQQELVIPMQTTIKPGEEFSFMYPINNPQFLSGYESNSEITIQFKNPIAKEKGGFRFLGSDITSGR